MDKNGAVVNDFSKADKSRCADFLKILKENGCTKCFSNNGIIKGTKHAKGHADHIHVGF
jgi:hypothetical protein